MAGAEAIAPAILNYLSHGAYPETEPEDIASIELSTDNLTTVLASLNEAQEEIRTEIRSQSRAAAPDVDSWIARAKELQADILQSRETARQIVAEAESGRGLAATAKDLEDKVALLEKEITFNETLFGTLEHVKYASILLDRVQQCIVSGDVGKAIDDLDSADASISALQRIEATKVFEVLRQRASHLKDDLAKTVDECWNHLIVISSDKKRLEVAEEWMPPASRTAMTLEVIVSAAQALKTFDGLIRKMRRELERAIISPRLDLIDEGRVERLVVEGDSLQCSGPGDDLTISSLFSDIRLALEFLSSHLPRAITQPLAELLIPDAITKIEMYWLQPALPSDLSDLDGFQFICDEVAALTDYLTNHNWPGSEKLGEWTQNVPRTWLAKKREILLHDVRHLVFVGLADTQVVERVETQMVSKQEAFAATGGGVTDAGDDWGDAWDEPDEHRPVTEKQTQGGQSVDDEEDMSAWEIDDDNDVTSGSKDDGEASAWDTDRVAAKDKTPGEDNDDEAWGWDEGETKSTHLPSQDSTKEPASTNPSGAHSSNEREITLRESYSITAVPGGVLKIIQQLIADAETLAEPTFASSPVAPAATALYSLPTQALAMYRATAPMAYSKIGTGNMLIYNDSNRLADQLRAWQADRPPTSRLRLDNDVKSLELFAKRAYSTEMEAQRTILRDLIDGAQGFSNSTVAPYKTECESAVEQTIDRLREVSKQWKDILSPSALLQSLGSLLATVTGKMIVDIEDLGDISEADSHQLKALIERMTSVKDLFQQQPGQSDTSQMDMTFVYCPNWTKFLYLAEILDSSLADIKYMWKEGELSLEFAADEIVGLIEALFAESELRRQAIREVMKGART